MTLRSGGRHCRSGGQYWRPAHRDLGVAQVVSVPSRPNPKSTSPTTPHRIPPRPGAVLATSQFRRYKFCGVQVAIQYMDRSMSCVGVGSVVNAHSIGWEAGASPAYLECLRTRRDKATRADMVEAPSFPLPCYARAVLPATQRTAALRCVAGAARDFAARYLSLGLLSTGSHQVFFRLEDTECPNLC